MANSDQSAGGAGMPDDGKRFHFYLIVLLLAASVYAGCMLSPPSLMDAVQAQIATSFAYLRLPLPASAIALLVGVADTFREALLLNGRFDNLVYGSYAPGAPNVFIDDAQWKRLWMLPDRYYLVITQRKQPVA